MASIPNVREAENRKKFAWSTFLIALSIFLLIHSTPLHAQPDELDATENCEGSAVTSDEWNKPENDVNKLWGTDWLAYAQAEARMAKMDEKCLAGAPRIVVGNHTDTKASILLGEAQGFTMAADGAACIKRLDLISLYLSKVRKLVSAIDKEPEEGLSDSAADTANAAFASQHGIPFDPLNYRKKSLIWVKKYYLNPNTISCPIKAIKQ